MARRRMAPTQSRRTPTSHTEQQKGQHHTAETCSESLDRRPANQPFPDTTRWGDGLERMSRNNPKKRGQRLRQPHRSHRQSMPAGPHHQHLLQRHRLEQRPRRCETTRGSISCPLPRGQGLQTCGENLRGVNNQSRHENLCTIPQT